MRRFPNSPFAPGLLLGSVLLLLVLTGCLDPSKDFPGSPGPTKTADIKAADDRSPTDAPTSPARGPSDAPQTKTEPPGEPAAAKPAESPPQKEHGRLTVTIDDFYAIHEGMTYDEVVEVIGFRGEEVSRASFGGITTVMVAWTNDWAFLDASNMNATFQNGRLIAKAQLGLHGGAKRERDMLSQEQRLQAEVAIQESRHAEAAKAQEEIREARARQQAAAEKARWHTWTSEDGGFTVEAKFLKVIAGSVYLQKRNGDQIEVPLEKLSEDDQEWIRGKGWKKALEFSP